MAGRLAKIFKGDRTLWVLLVFLSLISLVIVYSATGKLAYREADGNTMYYLVRQIVFILVGFGIMLLLVNIVPVVVYFKSAPFFVIITILAIIMAIIQYKLTGNVDKETSRSLTLPFISFQPAELAKISLVMYASRLLSKAQRTEEELKVAFYWITGVSGMVCFLIFMSNFSTAALIFFTIMVLMLIARVAFKYILSLVGIGALMVLLIYFTADFFPDSVGRVHTVKARIDDFVRGDNDATKGTTQADYARLAIFEGGMLGKGPGNSEVSNYMEAGYNDFIYAIYIEEYGFIGGAFLALLYLILLFRGVTIVRRCDRTFPAFLVTGLVLLMIFQAFINMAVSVGAVPVTGQPLPWVSMGGSSMLFTAVSFGIILAVSAHNQKNKDTTDQLVVADIPNEDQAL
ncbi:MAG: FtsW/RodA/SpoVE family cell cycle protein [Prolixibacteraceae bacterium]|jgi:cell division protein FtsW|nr:FtsW/RodA/SpoVE family cell cycle protein [Prolixibacteraceae bacterium]